MQQLLSVFMYHPLREVLQYKQHFIVVAGWEELTFTTFDHLSV